MDRIDIPTCALDRQATTVIVRNNMEVSRCRGQSEACPMTDSPKIVHRPSGCERCSRTRLISQYSVCDSGIVGKCRSYKSSAARSRYVNVCAAVCLLLLIGGLSPKSCAAPHRSRTMERERRDSNEENALWNNPCSYNSSNSGGDYTPKTARDVALLAKNAMQRATEYKGIFAEMHGYVTFEKLLTIWKDEDEGSWLRKLPWVDEVVLPKNKVLFEAMDDQDILKTVDKIDDHLPAMYKTLKMVVAGLHMLSENLKNDRVSADQQLADNFSRTVQDVITVLCYFYDLMKARGAEILPLYDKEVAAHIEGNKIDIALLVYRDTLNYLEYLTTVFQKMSEVTK